MTEHNRLIIEGIIRKTLQDIDTIDFVSQEELDEFVTALKDSFKSLTNYVVGI